MVDIKIMNFFLVQVQKPWWFKWWLCNVVQFLWHNLYIKYGEIVFKWCEICYMHVHVVLD